MRMFFFCFFFLALHFLSTNYSYNTINENQDIKPLFLYSFFQDEIKAQVFLSVTLMLTRSG